MQLLQQQKDAVFYKTPQSFIKLPDCVNVPISVLKINYIETYLFKQIFMQL